MPLHRNERFQLKTLSFKEKDTFVEENYMLSREGVTVFTQVSSQENIKFNPEFVFKGKGTRTEAVDSVKYKWFVNGSCLEQMLKTNSTLPSRFTRLCCSSNP